MAINDTVFSEYEVRKLTFGFGEGEICDVVCVGSLEEESEVVVVQKKCRGVVAKTRTRGTGSGTLKLTAHIPFELFVRAFGMNDDRLTEGVYGYGKNSLHPNMWVAADVYDEDDVRKLKAWPKCSMSTGPARKVENGSEEVAEVECEISFNPDENDIGIYEALYDEITDDNVKQKWLTEFTPSLMLKSPTDPVE